MTTTTDQLLMPTPNRHMSGILGEMSFRSLTFAWIDDLAEPVNGIQRVRFS